MKQQETQENCSVTVEEVRQAGNDGVKRIVFGIVDCMEGTRNLHRNAEPEQIKGENTKLSQIRETIKQNAEGCVTIAGDFFRRLSPGGMKHDDRMERNGKCIERDAAEEQDEGPVNQRKRHPNRSAVEIRN